jgi:hypothetical protein
VVHGKRCNNQSSQKGLNQELNFISSKRTLVGNLLGGIEHVVSGMTTPMKGTASREYRDRSDYPRPFSAFSDFGLVLPCFQRDSGRCWVPDEG